VVKNGSDATMNSTNYGGYPVGHIEFRKAIKRTGKINNVIYHNNSRLCFLVNDEKVIVLTALQAFILEPVEVPGDLWRRRLMKVREHILKRKIQCLEDLFIECSGAINLVPTLVERHV